MICIGNLLDSLCGIEALQVFVRHGMFFHQYTQHLITKPFSCRECNSGLYNKSVCFTTASSTCQDCLWLMANFLAASASEKQTWPP